MADITDFYNADWNWWPELDHLHATTATYMPCDDAPFTPSATSLVNSSEYMSTSPETPCDTQIEEASQCQSRKRRQPSEGSQSDGLTRPRKIRKLIDPHETAKVREKGACFYRKKEKRRCQDGDSVDGSCRRCLERADKITVIPGLIRPLCWRPNIGSTEVFRRGPTIDYAASLRGNSEDSGPGKQGLWKHFATRRSGNEKPKVIELSQDASCKNTMRIRLDRYQPMETDKQYYSWFDDGAERQYQTPAYGIAKLEEASSAIEEFLRENFDRYVEIHLGDANEITRKTFQTAQKHKRLPLVARALKLWVGCRFIEEPWSIAGSETLGMVRDVNDNSPYHSRIPVPPIVDLQIDLIVINDILQPELKRILRNLKEKLESSDPWTNWFEIYLAYFILLHNVELTMAHDAWFVKTYNLKTKYSNRPLVNAIMQGATTLLTCFHYAHQGFAPFTDVELEHTQNFAEEQKAYLHAVRPMLQRTRGDHVHDPSRELFWTSQLHRRDWRPVVLV